MRKFHNFFLPLTLILLTSSVFAQENQFFAHQELSRDSLLIIARSITESVRNITLITVDENGKPQARIMSQLPLEKDWVIWLGTRPRSRKVQQIKKNPNVMVFYYNAEDGSYVSIAGQASIVNDPEKKSHHWMEGWEKYYPNRDKDYILIKVIPKRLEIVSYKHELFWPNLRPHFVEF